MHDWDLVERHIPPAWMTLALSKEEARAQLVRQAVTNAPLCTAREIALLFGWERNLAEALVGAQVESGALIRGRVEGQKELGYRVVG